MSRNSKGSGLPRPTEPNTRVSSTQQNVNAGNTSSNSNGNSRSNSNNAVNGTSLAFDYSNWEDAAEEFNFLSESASLPIEPSTAAASAFSPVNTGTNTAPSPTDYALQLQQYQNLLMETQNITNLKKHSAGAESEHSPEDHNIGSSAATKQLSVNRQDPRSQVVDVATAAAYSSSSVLAGRQHIPTVQAPYGQIPYAGSPSPISSFMPSYAGSPSAVMSQPQQFQQQMALQMAQLAAVGQQQQLPQQQQQQQLQQQPALQQYVGPEFSASSTNASRSRKHKEPPQPRTKVRPCDHCRRRKTKCIMIPEINSCKMCQAKGLKCTFTETNSSLKRGLSNSEANSKRIRIEDPTIQPPPNIAVRDVHPVRDYATMPGRSLLKKTLSLQYPRSSFYVGSTSIYDSVFLNRITLDKIDQFTLDKTNSIRKVADTVQFVLRDDFSEALYEKSERDADTVERYVAPHGQALIDLYFRTVHPSFPVLHKKIFLEKYSRTHREFGAPLLAAVYLLAIQWWDYDRTLSQFPKPNVESLHRFAIRSFADVIHRPKLSAVQAGLLLLQCRTPDTSDKNWLLCSQVVALAEELGLGLECGTWRLPRWERGLRRRLAWAVYVQDKWSSLVEARPSHIIEGKNWLVKKVCDDDFPEKGNDLDSMKEGSADVENGKKAFKQMISLSEILGEILDTFFTASAMQEIRSIDAVLSHAKPLQLKLRNWYHSLPKELQMSSLRPRQFNNNGALQLSYFATEITLHRRIILALHQQTDPPPPPQLVSVCRNAAHTRLTASIEFACELKAEHMQAFWYSSAVNNFALIGVFAAILYVTSSSPEEAAGFKEQLFDYRWVLKVNSRSFDIANRALEKIDGLLRNIPGLLNEYGSTSTVTTSFRRSHADIATSADISKRRKPSGDSKLKNVNLSSSSSKANGVASSLSSPEKPRKTGSTANSSPMRPATASSSQNGKSPLALAQQKYQTSQSQQTRQSQTDSPHNIQGNISAVPTPIVDGMDTPADHLGIKKEVKEDAESDRHNDDDDDGDDDDL
ncbi:DEKNAAC100608 [Brettanomyces naardenensis]|uniref:DEKNAAC100608 n=1 Tax=Brettanomyces naardenensis TaxID=13370 RepID=A0A448YFB3_BRENA|nr:DEKNAAC100608 [Brettanomyces naardenensis]